MVLINDNWEQINDLSDVMNIVRENINDDFTKEVERIYEESLYELQDKLSDLECEISDKQKVNQVSCKRKENKNENCRRTKSLY